SSSDTSESACDQPMPGRRPLQSGGMSVVRFGHSDALWSEFPALVPGVLVADGISCDVAVAPRSWRFLEVATGRLATSSEGELPEIQAWRRGFARMGLRPT